MTAVSAPVSSSVTDRATALAQVRAVAANEAQACDRAAQFPTKALQALRETGLLGLMVPSSAGGLDGTLTDLVDATMALGRVDTSVAMVFAMHGQQAATLARYSEGRLRAEVLPAVARGELYLASVTTEPGTGGDLLTSDSKVSATGGVLHIDRDAPIVTGGTHADGFLITTRAVHATSPSMVDLVYAGRDQLSLEVRGDWQPLGMRATDSVPMRLRGTVPPWQVLTRDTEFRTVATSVFMPLAHIGWAAAWLGAAAGAYSRVVGHIRSPAGRKQFDPSSDLLRSRLGAIRARLDVVHALLRHCVHVVEETAELCAAPVQLVLNTLKTQAADECFTVAHELVELVGLRHGYLQASTLAVERTFRDLRSASLNYGNERLRLAGGALALRDTEVRLA